MRETTVRALPRIRYRNREYYLDIRLREFRSISYPPETIDFVPFSSPKGRRMLAILRSQGPAEPPAATAKQAPPGQAPIPSTARA